MMKVVILCGGVGQRISAETKNKPKPLIKIGKISIIEHIMNIYIKNGFNNFYLLLGYKGSKLKNYLKKKKKYNINFIDTGLKTGTAGRIKKIKKYIKKNENFHLTYGDGLTDQNIKSLLKFHNKFNKIITMTIVRPPARWGEVKIKKSLITTYKEKRAAESGWINGGFMIVNQKIFKFLKGSSSEMLEGKSMEKLSKHKNLAGYKHKGFWQCMDTLKEKEYLKSLLKKGIAPWIN